MTYQVEAEWECLLLIDWFTSCWKTQCGYINTTGEQRIDANMGAGCMHNSFPATGADDVHKGFGLGPPILLLREEAPWKKVFRREFICNVRLYLLSRPCGSQCTLVCELYSKDFISINLYVAWRLLTKLPVCPDKRRRTKGYLFLCDHWNLKKMLRSSVDILVCHCIDVRFSPIG